MFQCKNKEEKKTTHHSFQCKKQIGKWNGTSLMILSYNPFTYVQNFYYCFNSLNFWWSTQNIHIQRVSHIASMSEQKMMCVRECMCLCGGLCQLSKIEFDCYRKSSVDQWKMLFLRTLSIRNPHINMHESAIQYYKYIYYNMLRYWMENGMNIKVSVYGYNVNVVWHSVLWIDTQEYNIMLNNGRTKATDICIR